MQPRFQTPGYEMARNRRTDGPASNEARTGIGRAQDDQAGFQPYWGKPAVRNFRGDDGNVGIIRSPVRAIVLPDPIPGSLRRRVMPVPTATDLLLLNHDRDRLNASTLPRRSRHLAIAHPALPAGVLEICVVPYG